MSWLTQKGDKKEDGDISDGTEKKLNNINQINTSKAFNVHFIILKVCTIYILICIILIIIILYYMCYIILILY